MPESIAPAPDRFEVQVNAQTHFAWLRTRLAMERTPMAWVRTCTALIGFGFTIVQFFARIQAMPDVGRAVQPGAPRYLGLALIGSGVAGLLISMRQYRRMVAYLFRNFAPVAGVPEVANSTPLMAVALALAIIGIFAFGAVLMRFN